MPENNVVVDDFMQLIGGTPLIRLNSLATSDMAEVVVKMESLNPARTVKDRIALSMIDAAERDGHLKPGMTIVEPTSGNTGIGLAMGRNRTRLSPDINHARLNEPGATRPARKLWRRIDIDTRRPRYARCGCRSRTNRQRITRNNLYPATIQQPGQSGNTPPNHSPGNIRSR